MQLLNYGTDRRTDRPQHRLMTPTSGGGTKTTCAKLKKADYRTWQSATNSNWKTRRTSILWLSHIGAASQTIRRQDRRRKRYSLETNCSFVWGMTYIVSFRAPLVTGFTGEKQRPLYKRHLCQQKLASSKILNYRRIFLIIWRVDSIYIPTLGYRWLAEAVVTDVPIGWPCQWRCDYFNRWQRWGTTEITHAVARSQNSLNSTGPFPRNVLVTSSRGFHEDATRKTVPVVPANLCSAKSQIVLDLPWPTLQVW